MANYRFYKILKGELNMTRYTVNLIVGTNPTIGLWRENIAKLKFRYLFVIPSSFAVTYASVTLPCIGRLFERLEQPFFWINAFACPALFLWLTGKSVSRDVIPKSSEFSPEHYATLVAYPAPFHKNEFAFLYPYCRSYEASVEKLFSEGGSGEQAKQGDSASGGHGVGIDVVAETSVEDAAPVQLKRQKNEKPKLLMLSSIQRLLAGAVQNAEVRGEVIPTLPFVLSSVSTTPKREGGDHTKLLAEANLRAIGALKSFVISSDSSDHSGVNIAKAEVDSVVRTSMPIITIATTTTPTADPAAIAKGKLVGSSVFGSDSPSAGGSHPIPGGFFDCSGSDFLIGGVWTVIDLDSNLQKVYVPQWNVTNGFCLDDSGVCPEMVDEFSPRKFFASVRMRVEYKFKERRRLNSVAEEKESLLKSRCEEIESLNTQLLVQETEAAKAVRLRAEASKFKIVEKSLRDETQVLKERNATLEKETSGLEIQVTDLAASVKVREQEVLDLDALLTSVKLQNDSLADQVHKLEASFVGLRKNHGYAGRVTHGAEGRKLTHVAAYNPSAEADYLSALKRLQSVNFSLIAELKVNKNTSVKTIMKLIHLEDALAEKLGLVESQPHVDRLMVLIHHSPDQRVIGVSALSLSLDVSSMKGTFGAAPDTTMALSVTSIFASTIPPISTDDYEVVHTDGEEGTGAGGETVADESVTPFPNVSDTELDILE
nr:hypothetical protein [Tanacetum cinerariifolium]